MAYEEGLSDESYQRLRTAFEEAFSAVIIDHDHEVVNDFITKEVLTMRPYLLATNDGLALASRMIFGNDVKRDFIMTMKFIMFSVWGASEHELNSLKVTLSRAMGVNVSKVDDSAMPDQIFSTLPSHDRVRQVLDSNDWLITFVLIILFMNAGLLRKIENKPARQNKTAQ